jgi:hypothetical protein
MGARRSGCQEDLDMDLFSGSPVAAFIVAIPILIVLAFLLVAARNGRREVLDEQADEAHYGAHTVDRDVSDRSR